MARPRKNSATEAKPAGLAVPRAECPFSGNPLLYVPVTSLAAGHPVTKWQARGSGWVSTKLFDSREEAEWFFSHDRGIKPAFKSPYGRVEVIGEREPPDPAAEAGEQLTRHHERLGEDAAEALK